MLDTHDGLDNQLDHLSFDFIGAEVETNNHHQPQAQHHAQPQEQTARPQRMDAKDVEAYMMSRDRDTELAKRSQATPNGHPQAIAA